MKTSRKVIRTCDECEYFDEQGKCVAPVLGGSYLETDDSVRRMFRYELIPVTDEAHRLKGLRWSRCPLSGVERTEAWAYSENMVVHLAITEWSRENGEETEVG